MTELETIFILSLLYYKSITWCKKIISMMLSANNFFNCLNQFLIKNIIDGTQISLIKIFNIYGYKFKFKKVI